MAFDYSVPEVREHRFAIIQEVDLERYRRSGMGAYLRRYMTPTVQALRLFGALIALYASWYHVPAGIIGGFALVAACWSYGILRAWAR